MPIPPIAPPERLAQLFRDVIPDPPEGTFELGLVLGGTVSAGAYTAGALDFLLQALEAWHEKQAPRHTVIIKIAGGSSGGAVCASTLGVLSSRRVPHVGDTLHPLPSENSDSGNPLWDLWINRFDIKSLLTTGDIDGTDYDAGSGDKHTPQHVPSLLNCVPVTRAASWLAEFAAAGSGRPSLPYFAAPFRVAVTVTNLRGIPYKIAEIPSLGAFGGAAFVQHDDYAWFAFPNGVSNQAPLPDGKREDEFWLDPGKQGSGFATYQTLADFATASASMPTGLVARSLSRPAEHYHYRPYVRAMKKPDATGALVDGCDVVWPEPDWSALPDAADNVYAFTGVDGGTLNNDPVGLVHRKLAGLVGRNPRTASEATRAILMIDPLSDRSSALKTTGRSLVSVVDNIVGTVVGGARYLTADMDLFAKQDVFSRFQMVPFRYDAGIPYRIGKVGEQAIASASFFAAAGWCARPFRVHDYLLGRHNMQEYIRQELVLAGNNPLFDAWSLDERKTHAVDANGNRFPVDENTPMEAYLLPIIPDLTGLEPIQPVWPSGAFDPGSIEADIGKRLTAVAGKLIADNNLTGWWGRVLSAAALPGVAGAIASKLVAGFRDELKAAGL